MGSDSLPSKDKLDLLFERQAEGGYHVFCQQLPGLHTEGDTLEEATLRAQEALELYAEAMADQGVSIDLSNIVPHFKKMS